MADDDVLLRAYESTTAAGSQDSDSGSGSGSGSGMTELMVDDVDSRSTSPLITNDKYIAPDTRTDTYTDTRTDTTTDTRTDTTTATDRLRQSRTSRRTRSNTLISDRGSGSGSDSGSGSRYSTSRDEDDDQVTVNDVEWLMDSLDVHPEADIRSTGASRGRVTGTGTDTGRGRGGSVGGRRGARQEPLVFDEMDQRVMKGQLDELRKKFGPYAPTTGGSDALDVQDVVQQRLIDRFKR